MYDGYLKGPLAIIYSYAQLIGGCLAIIYLIYTFYKSPKDFINSLDFIKGFMLKRSGGIKHQMARIYDGKPKEQRNVTMLMKKKIASDQQWRCGHCLNLLDESYEVDHKLALFLGGSNDQSNLIALCRNCHGKKTASENM